MLDRKFMALHVHSIGSARDSIFKPEDMAQWCKDNDSAITLTDHGTISMWVKYYNECKKRNVKPIFGCELYINKNRDRLIELSKLKKDKNLETLEKRQMNYEFEDIKKINHILVVAKNQYGFHNLIDLHNIGYTSGFYMKPMVTRKDLFNLPKQDGSRGLIVTTACLASESSQLILNERYDDCYEYLTMMQDEFKEDFYVDLQANVMEIQKQVNQKLLEFAAKLNIKQIIGTDAHYPNKKASKLHELFLLMQGKQVISDIGKKVWRIIYENKKGEIMRRKFELDASFGGHDINEVFPGKQYGDFKVIKKELTDKVWMIEAEDLSIKNEKELKTFVLKSNHEELKKIINDLIEENKNIYEKIQEIDFDTKTKMPQRENDYDDLKKYVIEGLKQFKLQGNREYVERAKYELSIIKEGGFSNYFLILKDMIDYAKKELLPLGIARGCFLPFNFVTLADGSMIDIQDIKIGDVVKNYFEHQATVIDKFEYDIDEEIIELNFENGKIITCTKDHKILTKNNGWKKAIDLDENDLICQI